MRVARGGPTGCLGETIDGNSSAARLKKTSSTRRPPATAMSPKTLS